MHTGYLQPHLATKKANKNKVGNWQYWVFEEDCLFFLNSTSSLWARCSHRIKDNFELHPLRWITHCRALIMYKSLQFSRSLHWKLEARSQRECTSDTEEQLHCLFVLAEVYLGCISTFFAGNFKNTRKYWKRPENTKSLTLICKSPSGLHIFMFLQE